MDKSTFSKDKKILTHFIIIFVNVQLFWLLQGRLAMEWVLKKINDELKELSHTVEKNKEELINHTIKSIDDMAVTAKKSLKEWVKEPVASVPPMPDL